jgi:hypothetical protein
MKIKPGADISNLHPKIQDAFPKLQAIFQEFGLEPTITAGRDSKHMSSSLHYKGQAIDLRLRDYIDLLINKIKRACGPDYDVVAEYNPPHIHLEYDPKSR